MVTGLVDDHHVTDRDTHAASRNRHGDLFGSQSPHSAGFPRRSTRYYMRPLLVTALSSRALANVTYRHIEDASPTRNLVDRGDALWDVATGERNGALDGVACDQASEPSVRTMTAGRTRLVLALMLHIGRRDPE